jgi:hypothetical protein
MSAAGPAHPYQKDGLAAGLKNHRAGHVEVGREQPGDGSTLQWLRAVTASSALSHPGHAPCICSNGTVCSSSMCSSSTCWRQCLLACVASQRGGPAHPLLSTSLAALQDMHLNDFVFEEQYNQFHRWARRGGRAEVLGWSRCNILSAAIAALLVARATLIPDSSVIGCPLIA